MATSGRVCAVMDGPPALLRHLGDRLPQMEIHVDDVTSTRDGALLGRPMGALGRLALLMLKHGRGDLPERMQASPWKALLVEVWNTQRMAMEQVAHYAFAVMDEDQRERFLDLMEDVGGRAAREMAMETEGYAARKGREIGREEGRQEGRAELLLSLFARRFGEVDAAVTERVRRASIDELDRWGTRLLDAQLLADVFQDDR